MRTRLTRTRVLAIVALGAVMATTAGAQTSTRRTRPTTRIPVNKEPPVPDTIVRRDTVIVYRPAPAPTPAPPVYRPEPAPVARPVMRRQHFGNGFYVGIGGGASIPTESINNAYSTGFAIQVPIGWDAVYSPFGVRLDLGYTRLDARSAFVNTPTGPAFLPLADPQVYSAILDAKARIPFTRSWYGPSSGLYVVAGGGVNHFRHFNETFALSNPEFIDPVVDPFASESLTRFALNAGGGVSYAFSLAEVFLESRYVTAFMPHRRASFVPIILGVNFY